MKTKVVRIAVVYWLDAYYHEGHEPDPGMPQISAGILLQNDRKAVKLALMIDAPGSTDTEARDVLTIPRGMVSKLEILRTIRRKS